jgi:anti-sigma factor RsiW
MSHLDEGLLMALLDGELKGTERQDAELHLRTCAECSARLAELQGFMQEADGLVADLGEPPALAASPPVVVREAKRPRLSPRTLAWAASIVAALGLGFAGSQWWGSKRVESDLAAGVDHRTEAAQPVTPPAPSAAPPEVALRQRERPPAETGPATAGQVALEGDQARARADESRALLSNEEPTVPPSLGEAAGQSGAARDTALADLAARRDNRSQPTEPAAKAAEQFARAETSVTQQMAPRAAIPNAANLRLQSSAPLTFQRVSMEEAVRHLAGVIRLIDGLTPEEFFVAGTDDTHPLVRVIYRVGPAEARLVLEQRRADNSFVASDLQNPTLSAGRVSSGNVLTWNDLRGFALLLSGPFSADSLFHFKTLVK